MLDCDGAWRALIEIGAAQEAEIDAFRLPLHGAAITLTRQDDGGWRLEPPAPPEIAALFAIYLPFCAVPPGRSVVVALGLAALLLDGVDGWLARRSFLATRFGARFDMEVDALSVLVFTLLLLRAGQAGAWVLAIGLARYIFVGVGWLWRPLRRELSQSLRRKTICVVVVGVLLVALAPFVDAATAGTICAAALVLLMYSFAVDCIWLLIPSRDALPQAGQTQVFESGPHAG